LPIKANNNLIFNRLQTAQKGDFVVYEQGKSIHLVAIHSMNEKQVLFEEIISPKALIFKDKKKMNWTEWALNKAPGHTSWILLEIDLEELEITECFSFSKNCWLSLSSSESMLHHLLSLNLKIIGEDQRKKIGQSSSSEGPDLHKIWHPPIMIEGNLIPRANTLAYSAKWPDDGSVLANKAIELYFYQKTPHFPFPHWLQVTDESKASFKLRGIDSGSGFISPYEEIPRRIPEFTASPKYIDGTIEFQVKIPIYYKNLHLFAIDESEKNFTTLDISFEQINKGKEISTLLINKDVAKNIFILSHQYSFFLTTEKPLPNCINAMGKILWQ
jgi:hypothetical protein